MVLSLHAEDRPTSWAGRSTLLLYPLVVAVLIYTGHPSPGLHGVGLAVTVGLAGMEIGIIGYLLLRWYASAYAVLGLAWMSAWSLVMTWAAPNSTASWFAGAAMWVAIARDRVWRGVALGIAATVVTVIVDVTHGLDTRSATVTVVSYAVAAAFAYIFRLSRQARDDEHTAREQTAVAQARTAVLDERARIAREIHDILAHTLSAQSVQLEGARVLLARQAEPARVLERVEQAQALTRDGMQEARRAVDALRGNVMPAPDTVGELARADGAGFRLEGEHRDLPPQVGLAVYRAAQEALTNARKYAPGADVVVVLRYLPGEVALQVTDDGARGTVQESGGGHGLTGIRERAELLGGGLEAGPVGGGFRVRLTIPT